MNFIRQMEKIIFILFLIAGILLNFNGFNAAQAAADCAVQTDIPEAECEALIAFYNATDGPNRSDSPGKGWNQNNSPRTRTGITAAGNVLEIRVVSVSGKSERNIYPTVCNSGGKGNETTLFA